MHAHYLFTKPYVTIKQQNKKKVVNEAEVASKPISTPLKVQAIYQFQMMLLPQKQILEMSPLHLFIPQVRNDSYSIKQIRKECLSL